MLIDLNNFKLYERQFYSKKGLNLVIHIKNSFFNCHILKMTICILLIIILNSQFSTFNSHIYTSLMEMRIIVIMYFYLFLYPKSISNE